MTEKKGDLPLPFNILERVKNKGLWLLLGYLLITLGVTSLVMELVGVHWYFLALLERGGWLLAFILNLMMINDGILVMIFPERTGKGMGRKAWAETVNRPIFRNQL